MIPTKNQRKIASTFILVFTLFGIMLTSAKSEDNYKNDTYLLPNMSESTHTENGYKTNIIINPDTTGTYITENGYKLDITINPQGIGGKLAENNYQLDLIPEKTFPDIPDTALVNIVTSKTVVGQGYTLIINVTVSNQAFNYEKLYVIIKTNTTTIKTQTVTLTSYSATTISFTWNTTGFAKGNCTISAYVWPVPSEADIADNTFVFGTVAVVTPGDVNVDGLVGILDAAGISAHWYLGPPIGPLGYDPNFDINSDGSIGILDAAIVSAFWTGPPKGPLDP